MNKKFLNIILAIVLTITSITVLPTKVQAASYKNAYKKALSTNVSGGIFSRYAFIKMKSFKNPVMLVIINEWSSKWEDDIPMAKLYCYKNGKVKKLKTIELESMVDRDDWKVRRKGKKYVIEYKENSKMGQCISYVIESKKGKINATKYDKFTAEKFDYGKATKTATVYTRYTGKSFGKFKNISKSTYDKAVKTTKKVKLKEHLVEREY